MDLLDYRALLEQFGKKAADYIIAERAQWADHQLYIVAQVSPRRYQVMRYAYGSGPDGRAIITYVPSGVTTSEDEALRNARKKIDNV
jgi:hypothetical protein